MHGSAVRLALQRIETYAASHWPPSTMFRCTSRATANRNCRRGWDRRPRAGGSAVRLALQRIETSVTAMSGTLMIVVPLYVSRYSE